MAEVDPHHPLIGFSEVTVTEQTLAAYADTLVRMATASSRAASPASLALLLALAAEQTRAAGRSRDIAGWPPPR